MRAPGIEVSGVLMAALMTLLACSGSPERSPEAAASATQAGTTARPSPPPPCPQEGLELGLTPTRTALTLGEPPVVLLQLHNCSADPHEVPSEIEPEYAVLRIAIQPPSGAAFEHVAPTRRELRRRTTTLLEPGESRSAVGHVYAHANRPWVFDTAGTYTVTASLSWEGRHVESARREIRVVPAPEGVSAGRLRELWTPLGPALYLGARDALGALEELMRKQPSGLDYMRPFVEAAGVLARSGPVYDAKTDTFLTPECGPLLERATETVKRLPDAYFRAAVASKLHRCLVGTGRPAEGEALLRLARDTDPRLAEHPAIAALLGAATARSR